MAPTFSSLRWRRRHLMDDRPLPSRKTENASRIDRALLDTLTEMLDDGQAISARAAVRRIGSVEHASSLTRDPWRASIIAEFQAEQDRIRKLIQKSDKTSAVNLAAALAREQARVADLESRVALLSASHLALIQAVGEMGGLRAWARFFDSYENAVAGLRELGALPAADLPPVPRPGRKG